MCGIYDTFLLLDEHHNGKVDFETFDKFKHNPKMLKYFKEVDLDISESQCLFDLLDTNDNGEVTCEDFVIGCIRLRGPAKALDLATLYSLVFKTHQGITRQESIVLDTVLSHFGFVTKVLEEHTQILEAIAFALKSSPAPSSPLSGTQGTRKPPAVH